MCFLRRRNKPLMISDWIRLVQKKPPFEKKVKLPSGREATLKSNLTMTKKKITDISNVFDEGMYQTGAKEEVVERMLLKKFPPCQFKINKKDAGYEIIIIILRKVI